ncbi:muskelin [Ostrinia nubilalis]|uniref:muskelin n=1 Tax=Ostrinia nubilalis TaxID=29057 RepID=UPI00308246CA
MDEKYESVKLCYTIHKYSSYTPNYVPENIMVNNPSDQLSKWFTDCTTPYQYIMLKLESPSIVETIQFGKYLKTQVSDLKKFQIFGGTDENNLSLLLTAGLKKDSSPETFRLRHKTTEGSYLPVSYIKIVPLQSWGPAYNFSIWYVELQGNNQEQLINSAMETINLRKEEEAVRMILKHLRRRRYRDAFEALSRESGVQLEGPLQARLWNALVENGDYKLAEEILEEAVQEGEFDWYVSWQPYKPVWRLMSACSAGVEARLCCEPAPPPPPGRTADLLCADREPQEAGAGGPACDAAYECVTACNAAACCRPGPRGGHQLVVDATTGTLYLFGGWNGTEDLDDLWAFDTNTERWSLLCEHSARAGGPSPRSCHKMALDPLRRRLYTVGRYLDNAQRIPSEMNSDLYMYDITAGEWQLLCRDTAAAGGPRLVFDHQMCIDPDAQTIYVFGGRVLPANTEESASPVYSGLYAYYIAANTWQALLADHTDGAVPAPLPRVSHSMLFHPVRHLQRGVASPVHSGCMYYIAANTWQALLADHTDGAVPAPLPRVSHSMLFHPVRHLQRGVASPVHSGCMYYIAANTWQALLADHTDGAVPAPLPRVSHSMLFHPGQGRLYMFAGQRNKEHLVDLWWWDVRTHRRECVCSAPPRAPPAAGFTQRATIDPDTDEIFVLSGMSKEKDKRVYNTLWVFSLRRRAWACVYRSDAVAPGQPRPRFAHQLVYDPVKKRVYNTLWVFSLRRRAWACVYRSDAVAPGQPRPRFAHQLVYDPVKKIHYLFGGNPGNHSCPRLRLDDLWSLQLTRPTAGAVWAGARAALREARYRELAASPQAATLALQYLRTELRDALDHSDPEQCIVTRPTAGAVWAGARAALREARYRELAASPQAATLALQYLRTELRDALDHSDPEQLMRPTAGAVWAGARTALREARYRELKPVYYVTCLIAGAVWAGARAALREARYRELAASPQAVTLALQYLRTELRDALDHSDPEQVRSKRLKCIMSRASSPAPSGPARSALREARYRELAASPQAATLALQYLRTELRDALDHSDPEQVRSKRLKCYVRVPPPAPSGPARAPP